VPGEREGPAVIDRRVAIWQDRPLLKLATRTSLRLPSIPVVIVLVLVTALVDPAGADQQVSLALDWQLQGPQAPFVAAKGMGAFRQVNLDVRIDPGSGSQKTIERVAAGTYDLGYGDINSMIEYNIKHPENPLLAVYVVLNTSPLAVFSLKRHGVSRPADLQGASVGAPAGDAARRLWPIFARSAAIPAGDVKWINVSPQLREPALVRGDVKAITGFHFTSWLNLTESLGVSESEIVAFRYSDHGLQLYGNAVMARADWLRVNGETVRRFLVALTRGLKLALREPGGAVAHVKAAEPLISVATETRRLELARANMLNAEVQANGLGAIDRARMARAVDQLAEAFALPTRPTVDQVFTDAYLPAAAARRVE
jgi:NitT/TauT family transport system substrate-binding protein